MIHEFAVEPELILDWSQNAIKRAVFGRGFGIGEPRIVGTYPSDWKDRTKRYADETWERMRKSGNAEGKISMQKARFDAFLADLLVNRVIERGALPFTEATWSRSAELHSPHPFHAILAAAPLEASDHVLSGDEILESERWNLEKARAVPRDVETLAAIAAPFLLRCQWVVFIDPHFGPGNPWYFKLFKKFFALLAQQSGRKPPVIRVFASNKKDQTWAYFSNGCKNAQFEKILPTDSQVEVRWIHERKPGEELHNRYILTDIGGLVFAKGLDADSADKYEDVNIMGRGQYDLRRRQYLGSPSAFESDPRESLTIHGTRSPQKR